jgi:hypothetical protein
VGERFAILGGLRRNTTFKMGFVILGLLKMTHRYFATIQFFRPIFFLLQIFSTRNDEATLCLPFPPPPRTQLRRNRAAIEMLRTRTLSCSILPLLQRSPNAATSPGSMHRISSSFFMAYSADCWRASALAQRLFPRPAAPNPHVRRVSWCVLLF